MEGVDPPIRLDELDGAESLAAMPFPIRPSIEGASLGAMALPTIELEEQGGDGAMRVVANIAKCVR